MFCFDAFFVPTLSSFTAGIEVEGQGKKVRLLRIFGCRCFFFLCLKLVAGIFLLIFSNESGRSKRWKVRFRASSSFITFSKNFFWRFMRCVHVQCVRRLDFLPAWAKGPIG